LALFNTSSAVIAIEVINLLLVVLLAEEDSIAAARKEGREG